MIYCLVLEVTFFGLAAIQFASILLAVLRLNQRDKGFAGLGEGISVIRPLCGIENFIEETLRSTFQLDYACYEIIFCVADADDPVIGIAERLIAAYPGIDARLLIGNSAVSANPKLNNLVKGWRAARHDWILMADSNVLMPRDHLQRMLSAWRDDTGLVCSPPVGAAPANFWAELECAFLNTYQARWQSFADGIGLGFAQGKAMLLPKMRPRPKPSAASGFVSAWWAAPLRSRSATAARPTSGVASYAGRGCAGPRSSCFSFRNCSQGSFRRWRFPWRSRSLRACRLAPSWSH
jgi:cellulose synthase/poly-beta-1,6-N-acetylglucosamine synthase-like glycosyltransferase